MVNGGRSHRGLTLRGIVAPAPALTIDLPRRPLLLGAFRADADGACPTADLQIFERPGQSPSLVAVGGDRCAFVAELEGSSNLVHVVGEIGGTERQTVSHWVIVPPAGDPSPICLRGPCAATAPAVVVVGVSGGSPRDDEGGPSPLTTMTTAIGYTVLGPDGDEYGSVRAMQSGARAALTIFDDLPQGRTVRFSAERETERGDATILVTAGLNELVIDLVAP
jgi:hypothetical protein